MRKIIFLFFMAGLAVYSQTEKDYKKIMKAAKVFDEKSMDKGITMLRKHMNGKKDKGYFPSVFAYEMLVEMEFQRYSVYDGIYNPENVSFVNDAGEPDSSTYFFYLIMSSIYEGTFIGTCKMATRESRSQRGDMYYRKLRIDVDPDSTISEKGLEYYAEAEEFFIKEDYELAELNYRKALNEDPDYYKALLYLGDSFWAREDYDSALVYYTEAKEKHPHLLEPRKYIIDALIQKELYFRAKKECLEAFCVFPGFDVKATYATILGVENKLLVDHRLSRNFSYNDMSNEEQDPLTNFSVWSDYRSAKQEIQKYCSDEGIIEENAITKDRYLEVYSIRKMLLDNKNDLPENFHFAAKVMEEGYLEEYVFFSLFHVEIYDQFKDFMSFEENRKSTMEFVDKYCIEIGTN